MKRRGASLFQAMVEESLPETETAFFVGKSLGDAEAGFLGENDAAKRALRRMRGLRKKKRSAPGEPDGACC